MNFDDLTGDGGVLYDQAGTNIQTTNLRWEKDDAVSGQADSMVHQWVTNNPVYQQPSQESHKNPKPSFNLGWRGAYLQSPIGPDPWGHRDLVNTVFLAVAENATDSGSEGKVRGVLTRAGIVTSSACRPGPTAGTRPPSAEVMRLASFGAGTTRRTRSRAAAGNRSCIVWDGRSSERLSARSGPIGGPPLD